MLLLCLNIHPGHRPLSVAVIHGATATLAVLRDALWFTILIDALEHLAAIRAVGIFKALAAQVWIATL